MKNDLFEKAAQFHKIALDEISHLQSRVRQLEKDAADQKEYADDKLESAVKRAADALYESDFISSKYEMRDFIKKASSDPTQLAKVIEKVCNYKDVSGIGTPSSVSIKTSTEHDPIYEKAFGRQSDSFNLLED